MNLAEKREKLEAIVDEQKHILESKIGDSNIFDVMAKLARLKYLEVQKLIILAIPTSKSIPNYSKGKDAAVPIYTSPNVGNYPNAFRGISAEEFTKNAHDFSKKMHEISKANNKAFTEYFINRKPAN